MPGDVGDARDAQDPAGIPEHAEVVLALARAIPAGRVATYGDLAKLVGVGGARQVGQVMSRYGSDVPWWRVLRAGGRPPVGLEEQALQHYRVEGTPLVGGLPDSAGLPRGGYRVDLRRARWSPESVTASSGPTPGGQRPAGQTQGGRTAYGRGGLHHVEVWVADLDAARASWGWLLEELGWALGDDWGQGIAWELGPVYLVLESGPDLMAGEHQRTRPGVNHLAFHGGTREQVDTLVASASAHGWELLFAERHPYAGGPEHYAAYLQDGQGFEVEVVAT